MGRRKTLTDDGVAKLPVKGKRYTHPDPEMPSHYIRVTPNGVRTFVVVVRDKQGKQTWHTIGTSPAYGIDAARKRAAKIIRAIREGKSEPDSFDAVAALWRELHCVKRGLRSLSEIERHLKRMSSAWAGREFAGIGRGDIAKLLDKIERENGTRQANYALQTFGSMANWYTARNDDYRSPVVRGMRRGDSVKRDRILSDDEIRRVWAAAEGNPFGAFIRLALLTGQRKEKVSSIQWEDIKDGVWTIATEKREKGNAGELVLPAAALDVINAQPRFVSNPYVFASGGGHIAGWSRRKAELDAIAGVDGWTIHDLRRTARSLMSRAGVRPDIAERVLGHAIAGVEGIYDRHQYREEKAHALRALANLIENIANPPSAKVAPLRRA